MKKFALTLQSQTEIGDYMNGRAMAYEREILAEISSAISSADLEKLSWFAGFGDSLRQILMNVNEHRRALEFGFTEVEFNQYGWFASPKFLEFEEIELEKSSIRIGRGPNGTWAYALNRCYGVAGGSGPLCVFCKKYPNREVCLQTALAELKSDMTKYIGNSDASNYKQEVLMKTLKAIAAFQLSQVQLALF